MAEMIEVQRLELTEEQVHTVKTLSRSVTDYQAKYGQIALALDSFRAQINQEVEKRVLEAETVKKSLLEATQSLQNFSTRLAEELQLDLSDGVWALNVDEGAFVQTKAPEAISVKKAPARKKSPRKRTAARKKSTRQG